MVKYSHTDIMYLRARASMLRLVVSVSWFLISVEEQMNICNGVGTTLIGSWLLTRIYHYVEASAAIHDADYYFGDISRALADWHFLKNMCREWLHHYKWRAWIFGSFDLILIFTAYITVRCFGGRHYNVG